MNKAEIYHYVNQVSRRDSHDALQQYSNLLNWRSDGRDLVLDAGCGPGDISMNILYPFFPPTLDRIVGVDLTNEMVDYARKTYRHPKLTFQQFDLNMAVEKQSLNKNIGRFDHIFSSYCLMWITNLKLCFENFYKLLRPGGDMLLLFPPNKRFAYEKLAEHSKWGKYMTDLKQIISPYHYWDDAPQQFQNLLNECGFTQCQINVYDKHYNQSYEAMKSKPINFLYENIFF